MPPRHAIQTLLTACWLAVAGVPTVCLAQEGEQTPQEQAQAVSGIQSLADLVEDAKRPRPERFDAAVKLVAAGGSREALLAINAILGRGTGDASGARVLLEAMARTPVAPRELWASVSLVPVQDDPSVRALVASAAGSFRTRQAAEMLVGLLRDDPDTTVRKAAHAALIRMSGRDLPSDAEAWEGWLSRQGTVDGVAWLGGLIEGLASRADEQERRAQVAEAKLVEAYRRLHLALAPEARSGLLASMLHEPIPAVRALAFDLIDRELASSLELGPEVGEATVSLLGDPDPAIRRRAAALVVRLAPESGAGAILERLKVEREPSVAAALLRGVTRWPSEEAARAVARWASAPPPVGDAALEAAWSLSRAGALGETEVRADLLRALRDREPKGLAPPALRLLAQLGDDRDRDRLRDLLTGDDADVRKRVGEALSSDPGSLDAIVTAAGKDPALYDTARRALTSQRPTVDGLRALCELTPPSPETRQSAILDFCSRLPLPELIRGAPTITDTMLREQALSRLEQNLPADGSAAGGDLGEGMIRLAEARLELGRSTEALAALDRAQVEAERAELVREATNTRVSCLLALGRVEEASALDAGADAWLRGLELAVGTPNARWVHDELTVRFAGALTEAQSARLASLRTRLAKAEPGRSPGQPETDDEP
ncbi:MAG: HEAT repeat domain-containing protein [Phycisphaerales bacterium]